MTVTVTGATLTGCTIGPYFDPSTIYAQTAFVVPIVDGNLSINTIINPNVSNLQFTDGNLSITTINTPNVFGPVFIGV